MHGREGGVYLAPVMKRWRTVCVFSIHCRPVCWVEVFAEGFAVFIVARGVVVAVVDQGRHACGFDANFGVQLADEHLSQGSDGN